MDRVIFGIKVRDHILPMNRNNRINVTFVGEKMGPHW